MNVISACVSFLKKVRYAHFSDRISHGLDVESLVTQLVGAEVAPAANRLLIREAQYQAEISAYGAPKGAPSSSIVASECGRFRDFSSEKCFVIPCGESVRVRTGSAANATTKLRTSLAEAKLAF